MNRHIQISLLLLMICLPTLEVINNIMRGVSGMTLCQEQNLKKKLVTSNLGSIPRSATVFLYNILNRKNVLLEKKLKDSKILQLV